jgi:hypothetical protein
MTIDLTTFRVGILAETWNDYEARMIDAGAPKYQRRDLKQAFIAGVVAYMAALAAAQKTATDRDDFDKMMDALEDETVALAHGLDTDTTPCDCDMCRAERGEIGEGVRIKTFVKGIDAEQAVALSKLIADFLAESGNGSPDAAVVSRPLH